jgi:hypothetical protein
MKAITDPLTGHDISIDYVQLRDRTNLVMCGNGAWLEREVSGHDSSLARVAFVKSDLESFGSFFDA